MPKDIKSIPSAARTIRALRDVGYTFPTAIADLVDNSITAGATRIDIDIRFRGAQSWARIYDNGCGMTKDTIDEALRFGGDRDYEEMDLGKFGFGMKTASLSQCRRLTVASRAIGGRLLIRRWDLDHVERTKDWNLQALSIKECQRECTEQLDNGNGTVVFWDKLDRVLGYSDPSSKWAENGLSDLCREVEDHIAMVFHRFLSGQARRRIPLSIFINRNPIKPWDPYARDEERTRALDRGTFHVSCDGHKSAVTLQPFILPTESQFSSKQAHKRAAGPKKWNQQQGFYVYRADRLIRSGGWLHLRTVDEHSKLARVALDFLPEADDVFKVNIAKMQVGIPSEIRDDLKALVDKVVAQAQQAYRQKDEEKPLTRTTPDLDTPPVGRQRELGPSPGTSSTDSSPTDQSGTTKPASGQPAAYTATAETPAQGDSTAGTQPQGTWGGGRVTSGDSSYLPAGDARPILITQVLRVLMRELEHDQALLLRILGALATEVSSDFGTTVDGKEAGAK